jgi:putative ABC transport system permease protein
VTIFDVFMTSFTALRSNILRTFLTMLGIIIGVGAVIVLTAASEGAQQGVGDRIRGLGSNLMFVRPGTDDDAPGGLPGTGPSLFYEDANAILSEQLPYVDSVASQSAVGGEGSLIQARVINGATSIDTVLVGTEPSYQSVRDFYVANGRFLTEDDITKKSLVTVLGSGLAKDLFGDEDPVGKSVRIFAGVGRFGVGFNFTIVGVMEEKGGSALGDEDQLIFVPLPSFQARVALIRNPRGLTNIGQINIKLTNRGAAGEAKEAIGEILRARHNVEEDDFTIQTQSDILQTATEVDRALQVLVVSIALISLVVGGLGIMNIMLVSVTERTREIGIRKAIGAKRVDILLQFLVEAFVVTLIGGILGVLGGYIATHVADYFDIGGSDNHYTITPVWVLVGLLVSAATGIVAGVYPAWRASRLDPIEALRHE